MLATVGALIPRKGQALVIEALSHLPGDTVLLLVGRGEDEAAIIALRGYYQRVDRALMQTLSGVMKAKG